MTDEKQDPILFHFKHWSDIKCWVICNSSKQPCTIHDGAYLIPTEKNPVVPHHYLAGSLLRWLTEPQDHITTLDTVYSISKRTKAFGFGIFVGRENNIACFDFDGVISSDGMVNPKIDSFLDWLNTYTEISSSGNGIHAYVCVEGKPHEFGFNKEVCDGKFYVNRFIKLTGNIYRHFDTPIKVISEREFLEIERSIGPVYQQNTNVHKSVYTGNSNSDWPTILSEVGIPFIEAKEYIGKTRVHGGISKTVVWSARIICPNYRSHTGWEKRGLKLSAGGGDVAILTKYDDDTTSVVCNHNHCDGKTYKPNLLKILWDDIKRKRISNVLPMLRSVGIDI